MINISKAACLIRSPTAAPPNIPFNAAALWLLQGKQVSPDSGERLKFTTGVSQFKKKQSKKPACQSMVNGLLEIGIQEWCSLLCKRPFVAAGSCFPLDKHEDKRESRDTGEQKYAESTRSRLARAGTAPRRRPADFLQLQKQNELDPLSSRPEAFRASPEGQLPFRDRAKLFRPENIFLHTHRSGTEGSLWQVAVFPLQDVPLRPPLQKKTWLVRRPVYRRRGQRLSWFNLRA